MAKKDGWGPFTLAETSVPPGTKRRVALPLGRLPTDLKLDLPVVVLRGKKPGPRLFITAALHGDEINGVEIVRSAVAAIDPKKLSGMILAAPVINVYGFLYESRYLPDRRDLNRSFPGRARGSLASRTAHLVMEQIVRPCTHGIDLHTGSDHRTNYPQIRANLDDPHTLELARAFGAPVMMHSVPPKGTIRGAATKQGTTMLLYEAGEVLRFDEEAIRVGRVGIMRVLDHLDMLAYEEPEPYCAEPIRANATTWVRARRGGILRLSKKMGDRVAKGEVMGAVEDILGNKSSALKAPCDGVIIGGTDNPLTYRGDAVLHIAKLEPSAAS